MRRLALTCALVAAAAPAGLSAQSWSGTARDGKVQQAIQNTMAAHLQRRGYSLADPDVIETLEKVGDEIKAASIAGSNSPFPVVTQPNRTFLQVLREFGSQMPWPFNLGWNTCVNLSNPTQYGPCDETEGFPSAGGSTGGGGATGSTWDEPELNNCDDLVFGLDASGNLIIPAYFPRTGEAIEMDGPLGSYWQTNLAGQGPDGSNGPVGANSTQAQGLRWMHLFNLGRPESRWHGAIGPRFDGLKWCLDWATVSHIDAGGVLRPRETQSICATPDRHLSAQTGGDLLAAGEHKPCPPDGTVGGEFHFYGANFVNTVQHLHNCIFYYPNPAVGWNGYAVNRHTTIQLSVGWPANLPDHLRACPIDPALIAKLTDVAQKRIEDPPIPVTTVIPGDSRPDDTRVGDLEDNPELGDDPEPDGGQDDPPPPPRQNPPSQPGGTLDLGPDPGNQSPELDDPPEGLMDPIFEWLPDLPSITIDVSGAECPTWQMQPFDGPEWLLTMDAHCPFIEDNRAAIAALMLVVFSIAAAMIILRA